ncbi:hypothetical protein C8J57DRAFT_1339113 [Mycena rebaudengoi]|nr:hypothetical protein C8J57DRAFT_1339113 [Mycena rebaudengoi]
MRDATRCAPFTRTAVRIPVAHAFAFLRALALRSYTHDPPRTPVFTLSRAFMARVWLSPRRALLIFRPRSPFSPPSMCAKTPRGSYIFGGSGMAGRICALLLPALVLLARLVYLRSSRAALLPICAVKAQE